MRYRVGCVIVLCAVSPAAAQGPAEPATDHAPPPEATPPPIAVPTPVAPPVAELWGGAQLDLLPVGTLHISVNGSSDSGDAGDAVGLGGLLDYQIHPIVSIGFAPRFIVPVKADGASDSGSQLDLRARATAGKHVAPKVRLHGIGTLGYSMMFHVLSDQNGRYYRSAGVILGFGAGLAYAFGPKLQLVTEISYQLGYQGTTIMGFDVAAGDSYLTMGVGLMAALR